eukprot:TCALIF_11640-PA protein Name:"Similar to trbd Ubiquitin thioesterase trabid (Drosophila melanogaster)" AED:0.02 eAED:0.02 QI:329/0.66/0.71/1/0.66/0.71/7/910/860
MQRFASSPSTSASSSGVSVSAEATEEEPAHKWACPTCTYDNWDSSQRCTMCRSAKSSLSRIPIHGPTHGDEARSSSPLLSTIEQHPHIICDPNKHVSAKWACHMCTYLNWPSSGKCVQCLTLRKRVSPANSVGAIAAAVSAAATTAHVSPRSSPPSSLLGGCPIPAIPSTSGLGGAFENQLRIKSNDSNNERNKRILTPSSSSAYSNNQHNLLAQSPPPQGCAPTSPCLSNSSRIKWSCSVCTYENWSRSRACVICGSKQPPYHTQLQMSSNRDTPSPPAAAALSNTLEHSDHVQLTHQQQQQLRSLSPCIEASSTDNKSNNYDYERRIRQLRRRMREADWSWLTACMGVVEGDANPVEAYINGGGDPTRKLCKPEVVLLNRPSVYETGHTLIHLAIRFHREHILAKLLAKIEGVGSREDIKCVPSYVAPDLASVIRRHIAQNLRQRKGHFNCHYIAEWASYTLPPEIDDLPPATQEQLYSELLDRDAQKELEEESYIINWSDEAVFVVESIGRRLSSGFRFASHLGRIRSRQCPQKGHEFYSRWREWEIQQALELDFSLHESQLTDDWAGLLSQASQPGASLEQIHVFCLAHVLRRPIIVYGVKYVKSWKGENLGYARFEGVYLPLLWEASFCSRSPIALGYTRGHFSALIPPEPSSCVSHPGAAASSSTDDVKACFLPLMTYDRKVLPVHFLNESELGKEEMILRQWLDVAVTDSGLWVAQQKIAKPPLLVAQMTEEWLNHYRKIAQSSIAPLYNPRSSGNMNGSTGVGPNNASPSFCLTSPNHATSNLNNPSPASQGSNANMGSTVSSSGSSSAALNNNHNNNNHGGLSGGPTSLGVGGGVCGGGGGYSSEGESDEE